MLKNFQESGLLTVLNMLNIHNRSICILKASLLTCYDLFRILSILNMLLLLLLLYYYCYYYCYYYFYIPIHL